MRLQTQLKCHPVFELHLPLPGCLPPWQSRSPALGGLVLAKLGCWAREARWQHEDRAEGSARGLAWAGRALVPRWLGTKPAVRQKGSRNCWPQRREARTCRPSGLGDRRSLRVGASVSHLGLAALSVVSDWWGKDQSPLPPAGRLPASQAGLLPCSLLPSPVLGEGKSSRVGGRELSPHILSPCAHPAPGRSSLVLWVPG